MREIKFRAWDRVYKIMRYVMSIDFAKKKVICPPRGHEFSEWYNQHLSFNEVLLLQYTGLKDRNGKEIYEGDIIDTNGGRGEVIWNEELATWGVKQMISNHTWIDRLCDWTDEEVIGNVYENPELLKGDAP